jgi:hypothetical protein
LSSSRFISFGNFDNFQQKIGLQTGGRDTLYEGDRFRGRCYDTSFYDLRQFLAKKFLAKKFLAKKFLAKKFLAKKFLAKKWRFSQIPML